eukprot:3646184-Ditylum_brightwellii.AAC.2
MPQEGRKELLQCMGNIFALSTTPCTTGENTQLDLACVANMIQVVVAASNEVPVDLGPSILGVQNQSKISLDKICIKEDLTQYYKVLAAAQHKIIARMLLLMIYIFVREGYSSKEALQRIQSCIPYPIMRDLYQWYLDLLRHLLGKAQTEIWTDVKLAISHIVTKVNTIHISHSGALIMTCPYKAFFKMEAKKKAKDWIKKAYPDDCQPSLRG